MFAGRMARQHYTFAKNIVMGVQCLLHCDAGFIIRLLLELIKQGRLHVKLHFLPPVKALEE
jgi:hypothetical protein